MVQFPNCFAYRREILAFLFFWWTAVGLGYASVGRFYAPSAPGLSDAREYFQLAESGPPGVRAPMRFRVLVPYAAGLVARVLGHLPIGKWNPLSAGFLLISATLVSLNILLVRRIGEHLGLGIGETLLASALILTSFCTVNAQLVGLVDGVEALCVSAVILAALSHRDWLIPGIVIVGVIGKETVLPIALAFLAPFVIFSSARIRRAAVLAATAGLGMLTYLVIHRLIGGSEYGRHQLSFVRLISMWADLPRFLLSKAFVYQFAVLLPAGVFGLRRLNSKVIPKWFYPSLAFMVAAVLLPGLYANIQSENAARPLASVTSAVLCIGAARALHLLFGKELSTPNPTSGSERIVSE